MEKNLGNAFFCLNKNCPHFTNLLLDFDDIEFHPSHRIMKIKTMRDQLSDHQNPLNKFQLFNREYVKINIDERIQELKTFFNALILDFGENMNKFANDAIEEYEITGFLINAVNNLEKQIIIDNSKAISQIFNLSYDDIDLLIKETTNIKTIVNNSTESLKIQTKELFDTILQLQQNDIIEDIEDIEDREDIQEYYWSQLRKNEQIQIKRNMAYYGKDDCNGHLIFLEPRIDFNSMQSWKFQLFNNRNKKWSACVLLSDYKVVTEMDLELTGNTQGSYTIYQNGRVEYNDFEHIYESFSFDIMDLIHVTWDGSRRAFGIKNSETGEKFEIVVEFKEDSELYFGIGLADVNCYIS